MAFEKYNPAPSNHADFDRPNQRSPEIIKPEWQPNSHNRLKYSELAYENIKPENLDDANEIFRSNLMEFTQSLMALLNKEKERRKASPADRRRISAAKEGTELNHSFSKAIQSGYTLGGEIAAEKAFTYIKNTYEKATAINKQKLSHLFPDADEYERILLSGGVSESGVAFALSQQLGIDVYSATSREDMKGVDWWAMPSTSTVLPEISDMGDTAWAIQVKSSGSLETPRFIPYNSLDEADDAIIGLDCNSEERSSYFDAARVLFDQRLDHSNVQPVLAIAPNYYQSNSFNSKTSLPTQHFVESIGEQIIKSRAKQKRRAA